ncbi:MAG: hypothetical protein J6386_06260 [Candidatus Synoicihabitans palmerolidicus]|nr:hypothetical protein [Candidatus Synoicihabitans palmerolidicus]
MAADAANLARLRQDADKTRTAITAHAQTLATATQTLADLRDRLDSLQTERPRRESALQAQRAELQRVHALLRLRQQTETTDALARQLTKAETTAAALVDLEARLAKLADLTPAKLRKLEGLAEQTRTLAAQLQSLDLVIELTPDRDTTVVADGEFQGPSDKFQGPS